MRIFRTLKIGISNLWAWLPIIWKDRDWDSWFIYQIIEFKLRRQSNYIGRKDRHTRAQEDAKDMADGQYGKHHENGDVNFSPLPHGI